MRTVIHVCLAILGLTAVVVGSAGAEGAYWLRAEPTIGKVHVKTSEGILELKATAEQLKKCSDLKFGQRITILHDGKDLNGLQLTASGEEKPRDAALIRLVSQLLESYQGARLKIGFTDFGDVKGKANAHGKLSNELTTLLFYSGKFDLFSRANLKNLLDEQKLAADGITEATAAKLKQENVDAILLGSVYEAQVDGQTWVRVNCRLVSREGAILAAGAATLQGDAKVFGKIDLALEKLAFQLAPPLNPKTPRPKIAVVDFADASDKAIPAGGWLAEELLTKLTQTRNCQPVERRGLNHILDEMKLQRAGVVKEAKKLNKFLGTEAIIAGKFREVKDGDNIVGAKVNIDVINPDGKVAESSERSITDDKLAALLFEGGLGVEAGVVGELAPFPGWFEADFTLLKNLPKGFQRTDNISLMPAKGLQGLGASHFVELPAQKIKGDFFLECDLSLSGGPGPKFGLRLLNNNGKAINVGIHGSTPGTTNIWLFTEKYKKGASTGYKMNLRLERRGTNYAVSVNGVAVLQGVGIKDDFHRLGLFMEYPKNNNGLFHIYRVMVGPLAPHKGSGLKTTKFEADFTQMKTLPKVYQRTLNFDILGDRGLHGQGEHHAVILPAQQIAGDFYLEGQYAMGGGPNPLFHVRLDGPGGTPVKVILFGSGNQSVTLYTNIPQTKRANIPLRNKGSFRLERSGNDYTLTVNGEVLLKGRGPEDLFTRVRFSMEHPNNQGVVTIYNVKIGHLAP